MVLMSNYNRTFQVAFTYDHDDSAGSWSSVHLMLSDYLGAPNYLGWCCGGNGIHY